LSDPTPKNASSGTLSLYDQVLEDIAKGELQGGQRLKVKELADRYSTGANPIREVLRQLQGEGFIEISQNRGATVRKVDADSIRNIFEILQMLEPYFVRWFAEFADAGVIDEIAEIQELIEDVPIQERDRFTKLDTRFHGKICSLHYNDRAIELWHKQRQALRAFSAKLPISSLRHKAILPEHRDLIDVFRRNDVDAACELIEQHVAGAGDHMYYQLRIREAAGTIHSKSS